MTWLSDDALRRLQDVAALPELEGTRYELGERIGQGGMGTVWRVRDRELARDVAMKVLRTPDDAPDLAARLLREARTLAALEHPGIVPVHDVGTLPDGRVFYAMKLVRGESLDARVRALPTLDALLGILERVCDAVAFAHAHGVIHRDLTPRNVMLGAFGEVLVMDWGVAKVRGIAGPSPRDANAAGSTGVTAGTASEPTTAHGTVLGTPGFMAPEQATGDVDRVDARADVYALGALLRWGLGEWRGAAPGRTVPRPLTAIAAHAMAADPAHRYQAVVDLARDVAAFRAGDPVLAYRERPFERAARLFARYRTPILLVLAYLVMRVALLIWDGR